MRLLLEIFSPRHGILVKISPVRAPDTVLSKISGALQAFNRDQVPCSS
jgi:hypothetical protein